MNQAWSIDIFAWAIAGKPAEIEWQFLEYDQNYEITIARRFFWQQYDEKNNPALTAKYQQFKETWDQGDAGFHETEKRQPGRSEKIIDQHVTDFLNLTSKNMDNRHESPLRAVRAVVINECSIEDVPGSLPINDNNQEIVWQYEDSKGWKNYCTHHCGELHQAALEEKKEVTLKAFYFDPYLQQVRFTKISIDLNSMKQTGKRSVRKVRAVHVTPILQIGDKGIENPVPDKKSAGMVFRRPSPQRPGRGNTLIGARSHAFRRKLKEEKCCVWAII